jgi:hypothetical protein
MNVKVSIRQPVLGSFASLDGILSSPWLLYFSKHISFVNGVILFGFLGKSRLIDGQHEENGTESTDGHCDQAKVSEL